MDTFLGEFANGLTATADFDGVKQDLLALTSNAVEPYVLYEHYTQLIERKYFMSVLLI